MRQLLNSCAIVALIAAAPAGATTPGTIIAGNQTTQNSQQTNINNSVQQNEYRNQTSNINNSVQENTNTQISTSETNVTSIADSYNTTNNVRSGNDFASGAVQGGNALASGGDSQSSAIGLGGAGGSATSGSTALAAGGNVGDTTSASISEGGRSSASADNSNNADNSSRNEASGNAVSINGDTHNYRRSTPPAIAPTMISQCGAGMSGAASGPGFGAALGVPFGLKTCQLTLLATQMAALNKVSSACEVMRQDRRVRRAMEEAGETCDYTPVLTFAPAEEEAPVNPMIEQNRRALDAIEIPADNETSPRN